MTSQRNSHSPGGPAGSSRGHLPGHAVVRRAAAGRNTTAILDAASSSVAAVGLRRTTLADVARKAGVSRMTVYREYGDAAAVFHALLTREVETVVEAASAAATGLPTGRERLVEATVQAVRTCVEHPLLQRLLDVDPEFLLPFVVERLGSSQREILEVLGQLLRDGMRDGSIRSFDGAGAEPDAIETVAYTLLLTVQSFVFSSRVTAAVAEPDRVLGEVRRMLDAYLRPEVAR